MSKVKHTADRNDSYGSMFDTAMLCSYTHQEVYFILPVHLGFTSFLMHHDSRIDLSVICICQDNIIMVITNDQLLLKYYRDDPCQCPQCSFNLCSNVLSTVSH